MPSMKTCIVVLVVGRFLGVLASTLNAAILQTEVERPQVHETISLEQERPKGPAPQAPLRADLEAGTERHRRELIRVRKIQIGVLATLVGVLGLTVVAYLISCFPSRRQCYILV